MKKTFKRLGAMFLAMVMAVSVLCTGALADESYSITIRGKSTGHTYEAYQVFAGDVAMVKEATEDTKAEYSLSNIQWGSAIDGEKFLAALKADSELRSDFSNCTTAADVANVLSTKDEYKGRDAAKTQKFASVVGKNLKANATCTKFNMASGTESDGVVLYSAFVPAGYYLIKDKDGSQNNQTGTAATRFILEVVGPQTVESKDSVPTVDKKVQNTTAGETTGKDATTASIGDTVKFTLTGTLPENYDDYKSYKYVFHDILPAGMTCDRDSFSVYVQNSTEKKLARYGYTVKIDDYSNNVTVTFNNLKETNTTDEYNAIRDENNQLIPINKDSKIIVEYSATLDINAVVGTKGNQNKVHLEYSNDPNWNETGNTPTGNTPDAYVKVYTTGLRLEKIDGQTGNALTGATFTITSTSHHVGRRRIYKYDETSETKDGVTYYYKLKNGTYTSIAPTEETNKNNTYVKESDESYKKYKRDDITPKNNKTEDSGFTATATVGDDGVLVIGGLGAGTYTITEIKAPDGYNKLETPITITISADVTKDSCTWTVKKGDSPLEMNQDNLYVLKVENNKGSALPSTGGMGTKLFYVIGGLLMAGAVIVLVIKKRRSSAE